MTECKRAEAELKLSASVFDSVHYGIMITDPKGIILRTNPAFTKITGYSEQEVIGKSPI
jgi:PAS domain S-box-containing protein